MKKLDQTDVKIPREFQYPTMGDPTKVISHKKVAVNLSGEDKPIIEKYYADIIDNVLKLKEMLKLDTDYLSIIETFFIKMSRCE